MILLIAAALTAAACPAEASAPAAICQALAAQKGGKFAEAGQAAAVKAAAISRIIWSSRPWSGWCG